MLDMTVRNFLARAKIRDGPTQRGEVLASTDPVSLALQRSGKTRRTRIPRVTAVSKRMAATTGRADRPGPAGFGFCLTIAANPQLIAKFGVGSLIRRAFPFKFMGGFRFRAIFCGNLPSLPGLYRIAHSRLGFGILRRGCAEAVPGDRTTGSRRGATNARGTTTGQRETKKQNATSRYHLRPMENATRKRKPQALGSNLPAKKPAAGCFPAWQPRPGRGRSRRRLRKFIEIKTVRTQRSLRTWASLGWARAGGKRSCAAATLSLIACLPVDSLKRGY